MRLIDADALIRELNDRKIGYRADINKIICGMTVYEPAIVQPQWIPVTERLPRENGNYIVTACDEWSPAGEGIWNSTVVVVAEYYGGSWIWYDGGCEYSLEGIVTHWMPLPEPYKEASK